MYIKKKLEVGKTIQVAINTPNIMVYFSNAKKCALPSK